VHTRTGGWKGDTKQWKHFKIIKKKFLVNILRFVLFGWKQKQIKGISQAIIFSCFEDMWKEAATTH